MSFPKYPKYKDTGAEWLGKVPEHWDVKYLGFLCSKIGSGKTPSGGSETYADEGVLFIRSQNVHDDGMSLDDVVYITSQTDEEMRGSKVLGGDILLNITGASIGRTCLVPNDFAFANVNQHVCIVRLIDGAMRQYIAMVLKSPAIKGQIGGAQTGAARDGLNYSQISKLVLPIPSTNEQALIAAFLDRETAKIDALVAEQRRLIDLLKEKRQAVISHAVTKGLNPHAPMKPSGISWLGEVPAHWQVEPLKYSITKIEQGWSPQCENEPAAEGEWGVLKVGCGNGDNFNPTEQKALPSDVAPLAQYEIRAGDILMSRGNTLELVGLATFINDVRPRLLLSDLLYRFRARPDRANGDFLVFVLRSPNLRFQVVRDATGTSASMKKIGQGTIRDLMVVLPPLNEQLAVVGYIKSRTATLDTLTAEAQRAIDVLQERRTALISAAVTGKIDVRGLIETEAA